MATKKNKVFTATRKQVDFDFEVNGKVETFTYTAPTSKESLEAVQALEAGMQGKSLVLMNEALERNIAHESPDIKAAFLQAVYNADVYEFIEWVNDLVQAEGVKK